MEISRELIQTDYAWEQGLTGKDIGIAFLDTGISPSNDFILPDNRIVAFKDFVNKRQSPYDNNGHGTHVRKYKSQHIISKVF